MTVRAGDVGRTAAKKQLIALIKKYERICQYCFKKIPSGQATRDHIKRLADGGSNDMSNLTLACRKCNNDKETPRVISEQISRTIQRQMLGVRTVGSDPSDRVRVCPSWNTIIRIGISGTIRRQQLGSRLVSSAPGDIMYSLVVSKKGRSKDYTNC